MTDTLRITLELDLADNPPLFQDLARFPKGPRRVNRLRTLAYAGLIAQSPMPAVLCDSSQSHPPDQSPTIQVASFELFGPAIQN
jgi:hypothetical protein